MTQTTARPAQLAPVRIGNGKEVHLGHLSSIKGPNGEPRYCSHCPASRARMDKTVAGEAIAEEITCKSCQRQAGAEALERAAETAAAITRERLIGEALRELRRCCPDADTVLVAISAPEGGPREVEFLALANPHAVYATYGWSTADEEDAFNKATEMIVRALTISQPEYLRVKDADGEGVTYELAIADTTYGKTLDIRSKDTEVDSTLGDSTVDLKDPGAVLAVLMSALIRADGVAVTMYDDGVEIGGPRDVQLAFIHGAFTFPQIAAYLRIEVEDIRDCTRGAMSS